MREQLLDFLKRELIGPDPVSPYIQPNGEEFLTEPPRLRYGAGILFPQKSIVRDADSNENTERQLLEGQEEPQEASEISSDIKELEFSSASLDETNDVDDDPVNLANDFFPSALGFSCYLKVPESGLKIEITAGRYKKGELTTSDSDGNHIEKEGFARESLDTSLLIPANSLPTANSPSSNYTVDKNNQPTGMTLNIRDRSRIAPGGDENRLFTFTLINTLECSGGSIQNEKCLFQVEFEVKAVDDSPCFFPYPAIEPVSEDKDERAIRLLYRNHHAYAIGHGCAPSWEEVTVGNARRIRSDIIPDYDLKPIVPTRLPDLKLSMYRLGFPENEESLISSLILLCDKYEEWIGNQKQFAESQLSEDLRGIAEIHIGNCRKCLERMRNGINLIQSDFLIRESFLLMNRAMLTQQLRYGIKLRDWSKRGNDFILEHAREPDIHEPQTWPDWDPESGINTRYGIWHPFQLAFILMNVRSISEPTDPERNIVDLIWFPTGGGKTEAYLGLSAFTIFLRRLRNKENTGTTVFMRYTLRLLTAQQFQRAASLICAMEQIRRANPDELGNRDINIGLWVGQGLTPNKRKDAKRAFKQLSRGESDENPFIILKCPWCGARMGLIQAGRQRVIRGYKKVGRPSTNIIFCCHNPECAFSSTSEPLPLQVIDEDIYENPPTLLIGTVDKFAMLPWKPKSGSLFGNLENQSVSPPELIIQDELHLISGPLGTMVGHYETLIYELCKKSINGNIIGPKIIASTATISRARSQCHALYNCGVENVFLFPPQCIDTGNSFFAFEDKSAHGRMYVGIHASGLPSHATTQVRVLSALLQATLSADVPEEKNRDPYWTIMWYFNSLRELGHAATLIRADIREYLNSMRIRKQIRKQNDFDPRRFTNKSRELTSRMPRDEIPRTLQELEFCYPSNGYNHPIDICLATNMISVGMDVPRLGLMVVTGQPKTTSEYIQTTSRVGRSKKGPGFVVTIYNTGKPRDRSHYEHFHTYHSRIYSQVEPTSVTPFSSPVRERALHAILIGFVRHLGSSLNRQSPQPMPDNDLLNKIYEIIEKRVDGIDTDETQHTINLLNELTEHWQRVLPPKYGGFAPPTVEYRLMYPAGTSPLDEWSGIAWPTPTSMRNVDASCEARVIQNYEL
ncbi:MAG: hypothetical protein K8T10_15575 [Candidatus Eremiobacteraeota bacterium]|nr:hypothetical protein [Candidatus Eremiobacteraeota bacterium]